MTEIHFFEIRWWVEKESRMGMSVLALALRYAENAIERAHRDHCLN